MLTNLKLLQQLFEARKTNQRLNRRCQELESKIYNYEKQYTSLLKNLDIEKRRSYYWANLLRDEFLDQKYSVSRFYNENWQRLPKPFQNKVYDGIKTRVDHTLDLLKWSLPYQVNRLRIYVSNLQKGEK